MKTFTMQKIIFINFAIFTSVVFAEKMDLEAHTAVIQKLEAIVNDLDERDASKVPSTLRLGDLLAERSRLKALKEVEQNCDNCLKSKEDRILALKHYNYVVPKLTNDIRGSAMLQKAHIHLSLNQTKDAQDIYKQITNEGKKKHDDGTLGQAHAAFGDLYFQKSEFKKAKFEYETALAIEKTPNKGLIHYRLSWCLFNLDQVDNAIAKMEMILTHSQLTEFNNGDGVQQDESFKVDVAKDLASFYARTTITTKTIEKIIRLSPESEKQQNLFFLGTEADRLGKKKESALVWMVYLDRSGKEKGALEAQIRLMRLRRDMGDIKGALAIFDNVKKLLKDPGCEDKCSLYQAQIKSWIIDWGKEEKKNQTVGLTQAYVEFTNIYPDDEEMFFSGAIAAQQRKQLTIAFDMYKKSADVAYKKLKKSENNNKVSLTTILDQSLVAEMDIAETMKNANMRFSAYMHYLELQPNGIREFEVRYQLAQLEFEAKNYEKSAVSFRNLALEKRKIKTQLQQTAATMSIESLIRLKNEDLIQKWSYEYAKVFTSGKNEFSEIHKKAVLNTTAAKINSKQASSSDLENLKAVSLTKSTDKEKINYYKNVYLLSLQIHNFPEAKSANKNLLSIKSLSGSDHDEAIRNRIWLAELELDFKTAYQLTKQQEKKASAESSLRLLWLAEMAHIDPSQHENEYLKLSHNRAMRASVIVGKVQRSKLPIKTVKPHLSELSQSPTVLARLALEIYSRTNNREILEKAYSYSSVQRAPNGQIIARLLFYRDLNKDTNELALMRLNSRDQNSLKKSLDARLKKLSQFETHVNKAVKARDIILQAITLNTLMLENQRLYNDLLKLPVPKGLKNADRQKYLALLEQNAFPYKKKAGQIYEKLVIIWTDKTWTETLAKNFVEARFEYKPAMKKDILELIKHSPSGKKSLLEDALKEPNFIPTEKAVSQVREKIRNKPFEPSPVLELKDLESRRGNDLIVTHLDARLEQMKRNIK